MNFKIIWFIIFCLNVYVHAQTVQGSIFSEENKSLNTSVLFKEQSNPDIIKEFVISKNGIFKKELKKEYKNLLIEVKVQGYLPQIRTIENVKKKNLIPLNLLW